MNLQEISKLCGTSVPDLNSSIVKAKMKYFNPTENNVWKCNVVKELLKVKSGQLLVEGFKEEELTEMLNSLCTD